MPAGLVCGALVLFSKDAMGQEHQPFRVMTYNVRQVNAADTGAYAWSERSASVMETIAANDPDIFGVQESSSPVIQEDLAAAFEATHDRFQPTNGSPKTIFFRRTRFRRLETERVEGIVGIPNPYADSDACHPNANGRTAAWVKLEDLVSGRGYIVVNAHVAHGASCGLARNVAAETLHDLLAQEAEGLSIVLIGDLNSDPQRASGWQSDDRIIELLEEPQAGYQLMRSARHGTTNAGTATFNSSWKTPSTSYTRLDYIFTSIADATTYHPSIDGREIGGITPSDHFPVLATIRQAPFDPVPLVDARDTTAASRLAFADVDGDGAADKIAWNVEQDEGRVQVFPGDGLGGFEGPVLDDTPTASGDALFFADVDGDGCADRIAWGADLEGGQLRVSLASCAGDFAAAEHRSAGRQSAATRWTFARIDADGCDDRVAWDPAAGQAHVALSRCDGTFDDEVTSTDDGTSTHPNGFGFADVTGDGLADKIVWDPNAFGGRARIFASNGDGTFTFLTEHPSGTSGVVSSKFLYADIDGDGHADKLFWRDNFRQGHPQLYMGRADGFDDHPIMVNAGVSPSSANVYFLADVDGSGSADLVAWNPAEHPSETRVHLALVRAPPVEEPEEEEPDTDDDTTSDGNGDDGPDTTSSVDTEAGGDTELPEQSGDSSGCACRAAPTRAAGLWSLPVLLACRRRRARRRHRV